MTELTPTIEASVRRIVAEHADLVVDAASLADDTDLYRSGLTSHASINVMLAIEDEFGVEFPQGMLKKSTFQSIGSIAAALRKLCEGPSAARDAGPAERTAGSV